MGLAYALSPRLALYTVILRPPTDGQNPRSIIQKVKAFAVSSTDARQKQMRVDLQTSRLTSLFLEDST